MSSYSGSAAVPVKRPVLHSVMFEKNCRSSAGEKEVPVSLAVLRCVHMNWSLASKVLRVYAQHQQNAALDNIDVSKSERWHMALGTTADTFDQ